MELNLIINGVDFARWAKEDGITQKDIERTGRSVVTLDGHMVQSVKTAREIDVSLVELRDSTHTTLMAALTSASPATVQYTDRALGEREALFYVSGITSTAKTVRGGNTYYSGVSFSLEACYATG